MSYIIGKDLKLKVGSKVMAGATSCNISVSAETISATTKESGEWTENLPSMKSWNVDTDGLFAVEDFDYIAMVGTSVQIEFNSGAKVYQGTAIVNDLKINSGTTEIVTYNLTLTGTGELAPKAAV